MIRAKQNDILSIHPGYRETLPSFFARFAAKKGVPAVEFAFDMGFSFKRLLYQDPSAVEAVAGLAGLSNEAVADMLAWTGVRVGNVRMEFRGDIIVSRAVRHPTMRGCPTCLREDAEADPSDPISCMAMRGDWQFRGMSICARHARPLVPIWTATRFTDRFDTAARLGEQLDAILSGELDPDPEPVDDYDIWLDGRLANGADATWLSDKSFFAATTICQFLGEQLLVAEGVPKEELAVSRRHAQHRGFAVLSKGEETFRAALSELAARADGHLDEPPKAFGRLYSMLHRDYRDEPSFAPFRDVLRECILETWPVAAGKELLGRTVSGRRLHSLLTAAEETGVGASVLETFLMEAGAISKADRRPYSRKTFDAGQYAALLAEIPTLVGPTHMRQTMGATRSEFVSLAQDAIVIPRTASPKIKNPWRIQDGLAVVAELGHLAQSVEADDPEWERLQIAHKRRGLAVGVIIALLRNRELTIGRLKGVEGYTGFCVRKSEIDVLWHAQSEAAAGKSARTRIGGITASGFGRSLGIRDDGNFLAFVEAGHTPSSSVPHRLTGRPVSWMSEADIEAFHRRFVTTTSLGHATGLHRNTIHARLKRAGVPAFTAAGRTFAGLYRREDVVETFPEL